MWITLLPPSVNEWLPARHLARFVVDVVGGLDLSAMSRSYPGSGSAPYHPSVLVGLLVYGSASNVFFSWLLERATYDSVIFRLVASNQHPDYDTIASCGGVPCCGSRLRSAKCCRLRGRWDC